MNNSDDFDARSKAALERAVLQLGRLAEMTEANTARLNSGLERLKAIKAKHAEMRVSIEALEQKLRAPD